MAGEEMIPIFIMAIVFLLCFSYFYFNTYRWVGLKRRMTNRNWGIIRFRSHGKSEFPIIVDFDRDTIRREDGIWLLEKMKIYRQVGEEKKFVRDLDTKKASFNQGCPIINLDWSDLIPLGLEHEEHPPDEPRSPVQIEATLRKIRNALEAEVIERKSKDLKEIMRRQTMVLGACIMCVAITVFILVTVLPLDQIAKIVYDTNARIIAMAAAGAVP